MIDALHALMLVYEEEGLAAAKAWVARTGKGEDQRFNDLVEGDVIECFEIQTVSRVAG